MTKFENAKAPSPTELKPPFTRDKAIAKIRAAEDAWNSRDPDTVSRAYSLDSQWRNRSQLLEGRPAIREFLIRKWNREQEYRLAKQLWAFEGNRIAVRFQYEYRSPDGQWHRAYGNENWEFDDDGLMRRREASINEMPIAVADRKFLWDLGPRPADHDGLGETVQ